jgi:uncharacterized membrane protein YphA (DoxX/SURF4 family)
MAGVAEIASGPFLAAGALLVVTGAAKLRSPAPTTAAMHAIGLPARDALTRVIGATEIAVALAGAFAGGRVAFVVAATYTVFLAVAWRLLTRAPSTACGCIGAHSATVGPAHLATCAASIAVAVVYGAWNGDGVVSVLRAQPFAGVPFAALVGCCAAIVALFMAGVAEGGSWQRS